MELLKFICLSYLILQRDTKLLQLNDLYPSKGYDSQLALMNTVSSIIRKSICLLLQNDSNDKYLGKT